MRFKAGDKVRIKDTHNTRKWYNGRSIGQERILKKDDFENEPFILVNNNEFMINFYEEDLELVEDKMNKQEALKKIEELKKFVEECDKEEVIYERLVEGGTKWERAESDHMYELVTKNHWNNPPNDNKIALYKTQYGDYEIIRRRDGKALK